MRRIVSGQAVKYGGLIPRGYGISYWKYDRAVCYPLGINLIVRFFYKFMDRVRRPAPSKREDKILEAYMDGYAEGFECAREKYSGLIYFLSDKDFKLEA